MIELLISIIVYFFIALSVLVMLALIPMWVKAYTESEEDKNHIYNIFWEEAGYQGHKVTSASGCLLPFLLLVDQNLDVQVIGITGVMSLICAWYHSSIYKDYPVLTKSMIVTGISALCVLSLFTILVRRGQLSNFALFYSVMFIGIFWGGYAVYRRSQYIRMARLSGKAV